MQPLSLILSRVPKKVLEQKYKIQLPARNSSKYTTTTFLSVYALRKGWITGNSNPNTAEAAKAILKDYTTGVTVFCHVRPDYNPSKHQAIVQSGFDFVHQETEKVDAQEYQEEQKEEQEEVKVENGNVPDVDDGMK